MGLGCFAISHLLGMNYVYKHHLNAIDVLFTSSDCTCTHRDIYNNETWYNYI
jgi:hypothetical protein